MANFTYGDTYFAGDRTGRHTCSLIFCHGLGDTGEGWSQNFDSMGLNGVKVLCPTAPTRPVRMNMGMSMPAWFDLPPMGPELLTNIDWDGVTASIKHVHKLVEQELALGIPAERIIIGGFSQGGCLAVRAALYYPKTLGGGIALSAFMGPVDDLTPAQIRANIKTPFFWGHGDADPVVPFGFGKVGADSLKKIGIPLEFHSYSGLAHSACPEEMRDLKKFIEGITAKPVEMAPPPTAEEIMAMSVKELKAYLTSRKVDFSGCFEKSELQSLAKSTL